MTYPSLFFVKGNGILFGKIFARVKNEHGLTHEQLGDIVGLSKPRISTYISGKVPNCQTATADRFLTGLIRDFGYDPVKEPLIVEVNTVVADANVAFDHRTFIRPVPGRKRSYIIAILGPEDDYSVARKDFSEINELPPKGTAIYFDGWEKFTEVISATVEEIELILYDGLTNWIINCRLDNEEDKQAFTAEKGWTVW